MKDDPVSSGVHIPDCVRTGGSVWPGYDTASLSL